MGGEEGLGKLLLRVEGWVWVGVMWEEERKIGMLGRGVLVCTMVVDLSDEFRVLALYYSMG